MSEQWDKIHIRDLSARCIIGIYPREREAKQEVRINLTLYTDLRAAGKSDAIEDTVDYKTVKKAVLKMVEASEFNLIERMAEAIVQECFQEPGVCRVCVTVDKPGALRFARSVAVEICRDRSGYE